MGKKVVIGITTDEFARSSRNREVKPYGERKARMERYLSEMGYENYEIHPLEDRYGDATEEKYTDIVVSEETVKSAEEINRIRGEKGIKPLKIHVVPHVLADDFLPISSSRIRAGEIDEEGKLLRALRVNVGSLNPNKVNAVKDVLSMFYEKLEVNGVKVDSGVPEQPFDEDTVKGAINRSKNAIGDADLGIGIEAGLIWNPVVERYFDVQYCAIVDKRGVITVGHGPGFYYPEHVINLVKKGMSIGEAMDKLFNLNNIGYKQGAIGFLTEGKYDRKRLTETAVLMAFVPRIRREMYR